MRGYLSLAEADVSFGAFVRDSIPRYHFKREALVLMTLSTGAWLFRVTPRRPHLPHAHLPHVDVYGGGPLSD